jgi:hypothetical protein
MKVVIECPQPASAPSDISILCEQLYEFQLLVLSYYTIYITYCI